MHFHTPHLKKSEKRKASITSAHSEDAPVEKKATKPKKVKTTKPPKQKQLKALRRTQTPEDPHPQPPTPTLSRSASLDAVNTTSPPPPPPDDAMLAKSSTSQSQPESSTPPGPRRSSRIRNSMSGISETWHKARPYIERINGTIMPLEHQGVATYYARDGVKI